MTDKIITDAQVESHIAKLQEMAGSQRNDPGRAPVLRQRLRLAPSHARVLRPLWRLVRDSVDRHRLRTRSALLDRRHLRPNGCRRICHCRSADRHLRLCLALQSLNGGRHEGMVSDHFWAGHTGGHCTPVARNSVRRHQVLVGFVLIDREENENTQKRRSDVPGSRAAVAFGHRGCGHARYRSEYRLEEDERGG